MDNKIILPKTRKINLVAEIEENNDSVYIFMPPFSSKNKPIKISKTKLIEEKWGIVNLDWSAETNKICGIEIVNGRDNIDLSQLNQPEKPAPNLNNINYDKR